MLRETINWNHNKAKNNRKKEKKMENNNEKEQVIDVLEHLCDHIIYDNNIKEICYSGALIEVKKYILDLFKKGGINNEKERNNKRVGR